MAMRRTLLVAALIAVLPLFGCKVISAIVTSPSDSITGTGHAIGGSFEAISTSSGSGPEKDATKPASYVRDLREYVDLFMKSGGTTAEFQRGVSRIAESHGIADWEAEPATPYAIGQGLRLASYDEAQMRAFCAEFGADTAAAKLAFRGWSEAGG